MQLSSLIQKWSGIDEHSKIMIVTDEVQQSLAESVKAEDVYDVRIGYFPLTESFAAEMQSLSDSDLVIVMLSFDTFVQGGGNRCFSPFAKPDWLAAKYIFIRLSIGRDSLIQGLSTNKTLVYDKIAEMDRLLPCVPVRVTGAAGTDITLQVRPFTTCSHEIAEPGGMAFLPPSETSSDVIEGTANGKIVIDITAGQLYHYGDLLGYYGRVSSPVTLTVENGIITDISGGDTAADIKEKLFSLPVECRTLVELGQGLSKMQPTGLIGVDESIIDSCHFGFGDGGSCGVHWDVVISAPDIRQ